MITLLTDFGTHDAYVGIMKGVIASICPAVQIIDLTHEISPQDLYAARFNLLNAVPYFPQDTIHVVVVDPGVGTTRRGIAVDTGHGVLVGPDNGVMSGVWQRFAVRRAVALTNCEYWRGANPSTTFHGRDVFAPAAGHLAREVSLERLGPRVAVESLQHLTLPLTVRENQTITGVIQHIDRFGNGITNVPADVVEGKPWQVTIRGVTVPRCSTYGDRVQGQPLALIGSHGWVEIAVNQGDARQQLGLEVGDPVICAAEN